MSWLIAVVFRPLGGLIFFGLAAALAYSLRPLIPSGKVRDVLYDRDLRRRHPWKFFFGFATAFYGMVALVAYLVR